MSFNKFSRREFSSHAQQVPSKLCLLPPSLQWMFWNRLCAIPSMPMLPPACLNPSSPETFTTSLGYELKHHFLPSHFLWWHPSSKGKQQGNHVYLLHEHLSAPRARALWRRDLKRWQLSGGSLALTHQEDVCGDNAWSLHMSTCTWTFSSWHI